MRIVGERPLQAGEPAGARVSRHSGVDDGDVETELPERDLQTGGKRGVGMQPVTRRETVTEHEQAERSGIRVGPDSEAEQDRRHHGENCCQRSPVSTEGGDGCPRRHRKPCPVAAGSGGRGCRRKRRKRRKFRDAKRGRPAEKKGRTNSRNVKKGKDSLLHAIAGLPACYAERNPSTRTQRCPSALHPSYPLRDLRVTHERERRGRSRSCAE